MKYNITPMDFGKLVSDTDWFFVTSQYDIRRGYKKLKDISQIYPDAKISKRTALIEYTKASFKFTAKMN